MANALITGASKGLGLELAKLISQDNYKITNLSRSQCPLPEVKNIFSDLSAIDSIKESLKDLESSEPFELVVFNAGYNKAQTFEGLSLDDLNSMIDTNLSSPIALTNLLFANNLISGHTRFIFISSLSHQLGYPYAAVYAATKDGLTHFVRSLRNSYPQHYFQLVFPGPLDTDMARENSPLEKSNNRLSPTKAAQSIYKSHKKDVLEMSPGFTPTILNCFGRAFPSTMDYAMEKALKPKNFGRDR